VWCSNTTYSNALRYSPFDTLPRSSENRFNWDSYFKFKFKLRFLINVKMPLRILNLQLYSQLAWSESLRNESGSDEHCEPPIRSM
jgi:hypothetical protein